MGIQVNEELEALDNELKGQNFELQSWWDVGHQPALSISPPTHYVLSQSRGGGGEGGECNADLIKM